MAKKVKKLKKLPKAEKKGGKKKVLGKVDAQAARDFVDRYDYRDFPDIPWYNFDEGTHKIRVLPPWKKGLKVPGIAVFRHWNVPNPDDHSKMTSLVCPVKTFPESDHTCPICQMIDEIEDSTGIELKRERAGLRMYANIIARSKRDEHGRKMVFDDEPTKVWVCGMPPTVFNKILKLCYDPDIGDVTDLEEGYDLTIERTGSGFSTDYDVRLVPKPKPLFDNQAQIDEAVGGMYDLDEIFVEPDEDYIKRIAESAALLNRKYIAPEDEEYEYEYDDDDEEEEEEEKPRKKGKKAGKKAAAKKKPEPEEEEEEEEEPEPADEDEDEPEPEEEEDEDEEAEEADEDEGVEEEEEEDEGEEDESSEEIETPDEAIKALGLKPLDKPATKEAIKVGGPKCYGQYPKVAKKFREVCANCAYEYPCAEDSGLEAPY